MEEVIIILVRMLEESLKTQAHLRRDIHYLQEANTACSNANALHRQEAERMKEEIEKLKNEAIAFKTYAEFSVQQ